MNEDAPANRRGTARRLGLLAVAVGTALLTAAPTASAESWTGRDPVGDVQSWSFSPEPEPCGTHHLETVPTERASDLTRLTVAHRADSLELRVRVRALRRRADTVYFELRVPGDRRRFQAWVARGSTGRVNEVSLIRLPRRVQPDECGAYDFGAFDICPRGLEADVDYRRDAITIVVPSGCLERPRWVRVSAALSHPRDGETATYDTWTAADGSWFSPRIRAGAPRGSRGTEPPRRAG